MRLTFRLLLSLTLACWLATPALAKAKPAQAQRGTASARAHAPARPSTPRAKAPSSVARRPLPKPPAGPRVATKLPTLTDLVIIFRRQGIAAAKAGQHAKARESLKKALDLKPDDRLAQAWMRKLPAAKGKGAPKSRRKV